MSSTKDQLAKKLTEKNVKDAVVWMYTVTLSKRQLRFV